MNDEKSKSTDGRWTVALEEDGDDLLLPLPPEVLLHLDLKEGDSLVWSMDEATGQVILTKKQLRLHERVLLFVKNILK